MTVTLGNGLEEIGVLAFVYCTRLNRIIIPKAFKTIKYGTVENHSGLMAVTLGSGLEEIGEKAYNQLRMH
jgi:hypothetical protein